VADTEDHYVKPRTTLDWEDRLEAEKALLDPLDDPDPTGRQFHLDDNDTSGYVGADHEYRGYANETEMPRFAEEGAEREFEARHVHTSDGVLARNREYLGGEVSVNTSGTTPPPLETDMLKQFREHQERERKNTSDGTVEEEGEQSSDDLPDGKEGDAAAFPVSPVPPPAAPSRSGPRGGGSRTNK